MNSVNKTLYIPLYGKAYVSKKGIILKDEKAEQIWQAEQFPLKGKSKSKWLAYYMGMRAAVFDEWVTEKMKLHSDGTVVHIGCGMDSRYQRVNAPQYLWYDVDFPAVIEERQKYYEENTCYHMFAADASKTEWIAKLPKQGPGIILMEGISMYLTMEQLIALLSELTAHFGEIYLLMDCYTTFANKASKYKNPIKDVGANSLLGIDEPLQVAKQAKMTFVKEHTMTPKSLINKLTGLEKPVFRLLFGGSLAKKMYRLFEFES